MVPVIWVYDKLPAFISKTVAKYWSPHEPGEPHKVSESDKNMVRENILGFIVRIPPLLRAQLGECIKTVIIADYPEKWPTLLHWVKCNLLLQDQQILGALYVLRFLARKYEFKSDEERTPLYLIIEEAFPLLLNVFSKLVQVVNPTIEVADLIKLICKIFWSSIYLEIPRQLFDASVFGSWMVLFLNIWKDLFLWKANRWIQKSENLGDGGKSKSGQFIY